MGSRQKNCPPCHRGPSSGSASASEQKIENYCPGELAQQAQKDSGLDDLTFTLFWELKRHIYKDPKPLAIALADAFRRFPNFHSNADEMRELEAQLYKLLLPSVQGKKMVEVAERLIKVRTP